MSFICLYDRELSERESNEDIMLRAFGCKKASSTLICPDCNNVLGSQLDKPFAESLSLVTTLVNPRHRRKPAPTHKKMFNTDGKEFEIHPGGEVRVPRKALGPLTWQGPPQDIDRLREIAEQVAEGKGLDINSLSVQKHITEVGTFAEKVQISVDVAFRSACKSAFEALSLIVFDQADRRSELLLEVRNYIFKGGNYPHVGWMLASIRGENVFAGCRHSLFLIQSEDLSVYWEYIIYGGIVAISGRFGPINKKFDPWLYEVEPLTGTSETETHPAFSFPKDLVSWTRNDRVASDRLEQKIPQLNLFVNLRLMLGKHMEPLLAKVWKHQTEFLQAISKMTQDYVRETAQSTGKTEMEVMMEMEKLFPNGI